MTDSNQSHLGKALAFPFALSLKTGQTCTIRLPREEDAEELCAFVTQIDRETDFLLRFPGEFNKTVEEERAYIREKLESPDTLFFAAEVEGRIVGTAGAEVNKLKRFAHVAECGLSIFKAYWGQGIGRIMMDCVIAWGRERGLRKIHLQVFDHNTRAAALYESYGFIEEGRLRKHNLRADGTYGDIILMSKFLAE